MFSCDRTFTNRQYTTFPFNNKCSKLSLMGKIIYLTLNASLQSSSGWVLKLAKLQAYTLWTHSTPWLDFSNKYDKIFWLVAPDP